MAGNKLGNKGNVPFAGKVAQIRRLLLEATSEAQILKIWGMVLTNAEEGDHKAISLFFDRLLGPALPADVLEQIDALEQQVKGLLEERNAGPSQTLAAAG